MATRRLSRRRVLAMLGVACTLFFAFLVVRYRRAARSWEKLLERQQLEIPRDWARLAPYPESASDLRATTSGSMFTREFRVSFKAPAPDIERWLAESPGPREAKPEAISPGIRRFSIKPGGGAQHAEITVDDTKGSVSIHVYWS